MSTVCACCSVALVACSHERVCVSICLSVCLSLCLCLYVCMCVCLCVCVVHNNRKLSMDERPLSVCLSWVELCGYDVRGLDRHQFILVENDASAIDVSYIIMSCVVALTVQR